MKRTNSDITRLIIITAALLGLIAIPLIVRGMNSEETSMTQTADGIKLNPLTPEEARVIVDKGTEMPGTGKYDKFSEKGTYICKWCNAPLYRSSAKFDGHCGWPSFDDEIPGAVKRTLDADGVRTEITCATCGAHLGHVFTGEHFTPKNTRHCVNSISLKFIPEGEPLPPVRRVEAEVGMSGAAVSPASHKATATDQSADAKAATATKEAAGENADVEFQKGTITAKATGVKKAYFAGGCFWGVEYMMENEDGVINVRSGYMGGHTPKPTYEQVCSHTTGYAETVEIEYDPTKTDYETLARHFFEIHDPTQVNRQGPDIGDQYRSEIFYTDDQQEQIAKKLIGLLEDKGYDVATEVTKAGTFYPAEDYHQDYYDKTGHTPYCHRYQKRF
jgi:peptide methionine sulfoxide reductase msrA/msrB